MHEMRGAQLRIRRERALAYEAAVLPYQKKPPSFEEFVGISPRDSYVRRFEDEWDRIDAAFEQAKRKRGMARA